MKVARQTQWSTSVHEAGHAVVARVLGLRSGPASIVRNVAKGTAGYCRLEDSWQALSRWHRVEGRWWRQHESALKAILMAGIAGAEAEFVLLGRAAVGDGQDRHQIILAMEGEISNPERVEERLRLATRGIVRRHAPTIERVARALYRRKKLAKNRSRSPRRLPGTHAAPRRGEILGICPCR
jgi:hypothetical protein